MEDDHAAVRYCFVSAEELKNLGRAREVFDVKGASESSISWNCGFGLILLVVSGGYHQGVEAAVNLWNSGKRRTRIARLTA